MKKLFYRIGKSLLFIGLVSSLLLLNAGCEKADDTLPTTGCEAVGNIVSKVSNAAGRVTYDEDTKMHYLSYHVPHTIDVVLIGMICNMPATFPKQADFIEVTFSGAFRETGEDLETGIVGYDLYYLELSKLEIK